MRATACRTVKGPATGCANTARRRSFRSRLATSPATRGFHSTYSAPRPANDYVIRHADKGNDMNVKLKGRRARPLPHWALRLRRAHEGSIWHTRRRADVVQCPRVGLRNAGRDGYRSSPSTPQQKKTVAI